MAPIFDVFSFIPFPVFATDKDGVVIFKNDSCRRNLHIVRNGAHIAKHLRDADVVFSNDKISFSEIIYDGPFIRFARNIIDFEGSKFIAFFFLPMLQFNDHTEIERFILDRSNGDIADFMIDLKNSEHFDKSDRLYSDMVGFIKKYDIDISDGKITIDMAYLLDKLFSSLSRSFRALGIKISTAVDKSIYYNRFCMINPNDYIFVITRLLYAVIRASSTKRISLEATHSEENDMICVIMKTQTEREVIDGDICELAPECVFESKLISRYYILDKNVIIKKSADGMLSVGYTVPCENTLSTLPISNTYLKPFDVDAAVKKYSNALRASVKSS
ncbi:MAG: hypothetical protein IJR55_01340 [Clostridia bacterium]|nr:hypothetical protein [Clostridia bacterium]